ncbi:hypothetical protein BSQ39_06045 [Loigolactobacillus backii]|uniref:YutD family protein n=1 Tax=Loigolactobacillus backii TaxID=375175 RepID=UPI000C1C9098|nr:YutD family protein [Loigolactobacillus backii]PIO83168.1 hypothetical protein BSQ39_06045 [Loigolactobacillus backii]
MNTTKSATPDKATEEKSTGIDLATEISQIASSDPDEVKLDRVLMETDTMMTIDGHPYELVTNYHDGFDKEKLGERFSDILTKYDYVVGDWGYEQLRLKGFYSPTNRRARRDQLITTLEDYLFEYCNFGCAYFVLHQVNPPKQPTAPRRKRSRRPRKAQINERKVSVKPIKKGAKAEKSPRKRHFTIREKSKRKTGEN